MLFQSEQASLPTPSARLDLDTSRSSQPEAEAAWFAVRVRAKSEVLAATLLSRKGYETFTPTYTESRKYSDRIRKFQRAIFPGYLFCRFHPDNTFAVLNTPAIQKILSIAGQPTPISHSEIENARRAAASITARPHPYLNVGQKVRVVDGPLAGVEGYLVSFQSPKKQVSQPNSGPRLVICADLLQRALSVEIDLFHVVPL